MSIVRSLARPSGRPRLRCILVAVATALALVVTGCGTGTTPTPAPAQGAPPPEQGTPSPAQPQPATTEQPTGPITVYSGRSEDLIGGILDDFTKATGIEVQVKYGDTAALAATILEEGDRSPADVYFGQDAGALGALSKAGRFITLPESVLNLVADARFRSPRGEWVGTSARARVVAYNVDNVNPADLPDTIWGFTDPRWNGRIGWPPTNGSFQAFVTALRLLEGDQKAKEWLQGIQKNNPKVYGNNSSALQAVAAGEVDVAFINHYYLYRFLTEQGPGFKARNHHLTGGDAGAMINVAGVGVLKTSKNQAAALKLVEWLLSERAQRAVAEQNGEYPLVAGVAPAFDIPPLDSIKTPDLDLSKLEDLEATLNLLRDVGVL